LTRIDHGERATEFTEPWLRAAAAAAGLPGHKPPLQHGHVGGWRGDGGGRSGKVVGE